MSIQGAKPFYLIAHRVLVADGIKAALSHGANAIEIDMTAWKDGWWADHDATRFPPSWGDTARKMFETIAEERKAGKTITFVWLDIKNPDHCNPQDPQKRICSIDALRDLARELLQPHGVRVLYGFRDTDSKAWNSILKGLNMNEAMNLNGKANEVMQGFDSHGPSQLSQRIMSYGYFNLAFQFGDCKGSKDTCTELRQGVESGKFGKVFGWTYSPPYGGKSGRVYVEALLGIAGIDGLIYGLEITHYVDDPRARIAAQDIISWVTSHPELRYLAAQHNNPW